MKKISKSDTPQDKAALDQTRQALSSLLSKECQHFMPRTYVIMNNRKGYVMSRNDEEGSLVVRWCDNRQDEKIYPMALGR